MAISASATAGSDSSGDEFFEAEVRPLLVDRCQKCHGDETPKGGLRLTSRAGLLEGGDSGPAAVAGQPEESLLVQAIRYQDEPRMPPKLKLDDRAIATLTRWVAMGLPWPETRGKAAAQGKIYQITEEQRRFWSFQPVRPVAPPAVQEAAWPKTDIDRFILAALEAKGMGPSPAADKATLLRRATFDLTGLPPSPAEVDAFLADDAPDAFARVVGRLLASPRYGERWGRHWLDLVRYADSRDARDIGSTSDITEAWRYRDWVVAAFNRDLPYDRFVIDQIAGDLVPGPDGFNAEGLVATGLLAIGEWGTGDADKEKMLTDVVDDQIDVVGRAFLGLTVACARCHDHKFDPIPTADYYALAGIFFSTHILPGPGPKTGGSPLLRTPLVPPSALAAAERNKGRADALRDQLQATADAAYAEASRDLLTRTAEYMLAAWDGQGRSQSPGGRVEDSSIGAIAAARGLHEPILQQWIGYLGLGDDGLLLTRPVADVGGAAGVFAWKGEPDCPSVTVNATDRAVALLTFRLPPRSVSVHPGPASGVAVSWTTPVAGTVRVSGRLADADPVGGDGVAWDLALRHLGVTRTLAAGDLPNAGGQRLAEAPGAHRLDAVEVQPGDVLRLVVRPKQAHTCDTTTVELAIAPADGATAWDLARDLVSDPQGGNPHADGFGHAEVWRFSEVADTPAALGAPPDSPLGRWDWAVRTGDRAAIDRAAGAFQRDVDRPVSPLRDELASPRGPSWIRARDDARYLPAPVRARLEGLRAERESLSASPPAPIPLALAAQEGGVPGSAHAGIGDARIHVRGSYQRLGETVPRHFPRILAGDDQAPITQGSGRLELARWIARAEHPLTARVMVNRIWQYHFGEGLVRTPSNFGKLGERPTHPELLDFLAARFVASGWSIKAMHRAILLSAVYQQESRPTAEALRLDPENLLLGRMGRRRLEAEAIRDSLLAVSGRLDATMGGPSVRDLTGGRRSLYVTTIRSDRSSFGPLFDAADATAIVDRRTSSTVAPQALFLLNHPFVLEQARALARRITGGNPADDRARIASAYVLLYGRPPTSEEVAIGRDLLAGARGAGSDAWEIYCQVLLCANEFLYVD